jgi:hypothetical protein
MALVAVGCGGSDSGSSKTDSGTGGGDSGTGGAMDTGGSGTVVSYNSAAKAVFMAKCTPCHDTSGSGSTAHKMVVSYADVNKDSYSCSGKKKGACALERVKAGSMPCTGDPTKDSSNSACLNAAQLKTLEDWVAGGLKEN